MYNIAIMDCTRLTRDIDMAILSVRPSLRPSVRDFCEALICKNALSVIIIGPLSVKVLICKKISVALICKPLSVKKYTHTYFNIHDNVIVTSATDEIIEDN